MLELDASQIQMCRAAANKGEALAMLGDALASAGLATAAYLEGLQAREAQGSTFLGQGIAIPMARRRPAIRCCAPASA